MDNSLQIAVAQALQQNHQRQMMNAGQKRTMGMANAFMPAGYQNDNYTMRQAGNPYFLPEPQDLYITQPANMWEGSNPMTWEDYGKQMADDYGAGAQQPAAPAPAKPAYDATEWLDKTGPRFSWYDSAAAEGARWGTSFSNTNPTNREYVTALGFDPENLTKAQVENLTARRKEEASKQDWLANNFWSGQGG
jgi:hypothetical protein